MITQKAIAIIYCATLPIQPAADALGGSYPNSCCKAPRVLRLPCYLPTLHHNLYIAAAIAAILFLRAAGVQSLLLVPLVAGGDLLFALLACLVFF